MEVAFESKSVTLDGGSVNLDEEWFADRLDQCKTTSIPPMYIATHNH
jgi:hypothetical protein